MPDLRFEDPRVGSCHRKLYRTLCARPELREWLSNHLTPAVHRQFGPFGYWDRRWTMPVRHGDTCVDIVHWPADMWPIEDLSDHPTKFETHFPERAFQTMAGRANVLGLEAEQRALRHDTPLRVFRSPWSLLVAANQDEYLSEHGSPGVVILKDEPRCWARLTRFPELVAEDIAHAQALQRFIRASGARVPLIQYPQVSQREAA